MATNLATPAELATLAQQKLRSLVDPAGTGAVDLSPGSRNDNMISVNTALYTRLMQYAADRASARSLATATGDDLDALVADIYQDARKSANAATGYVYLIRDGSSTVATYIPYGTRFAVPATNTQQAVTFFSTQDVVVASGAGTVHSGGSIAVPCQCVSADETGNVAVSQITQILDTLPDTTWSLTLPTSSPTFISLLSSAVTSNPFMAGGASAEDDDTFRARIQQSAFDDSKRRGTRAAIQAGALSVPGIASVTVVEPGDGTVLVFCGDSSYNLSPTTQAAVQVELENWRAFGVPTLVRPYNVVTVTVNATMYMQQPLQNYNTSGGPGSLQAQAISNIQTYFKSRQRPDEFFGNLIESAIASASSGTQQVVINSISTSSGAAPDGTGSIRRVADSAYGSVQSMVRYIVTATSLRVNVAPPLTQ
jgi:uncharacterized phage protein gp47/JayE